MHSLTASVFPGRGLGFLVLGATLHDVLTRLKAEPQVFTKLDLIYSPTRPVTDPVIIGLPDNGLRLRFDGAQQRLRLIEVLNFSTSKYSLNNVDIVKSSSETQDTTKTRERTTGPTFRHTYTHLLGPTFPGEYVENGNCDIDGYGLYILSYPGIAFTFPVEASAWSLDKDHVDILSSSATLPAMSMAVFVGESWTNARNGLFTKALENPKLLAQQNRSRETCPDEVGQIRIHGRGQVEMQRPWSNASFNMRLGHTTPQDLVAELGPPDAIYRKNDRRMSIHKTRTASGSRPRSSGMEARSQDDSTDTDQSSAYTTTDASDDDSVDEQTDACGSGECFYNYFYHGFDILISTSGLPSERPASRGGRAADPMLKSASVQVATKVVIHSNVPGSYSFNRHRRCPWSIVYLEDSTHGSTATSETLFADVACKLREKWQNSYTSPEEAKQLQRGMVLNRDWGDSPGSSCELLGGWEDSLNGQSKGATKASIREHSLGNTTLYGYPGLVFEVLKNGYVNQLTVF